MVRWFAGMMSMRTVNAKFRHFLKLRPAALLSPVIGLMKGLTDPVVGLLMGQTAENLAWKFGINRQQMTKFTNILPANYESDASGYVLNLYPDPEAMSVEFRMVAGKWQSAPGPDAARREGIVTTVRGRNLGTLAAILTVCWVQLEGVATPAIVVSQLMLAFIVLGCVAVLSYRNDD